MAPADLQWVGRSVIASKGNLTFPLKLWYYPPETLSTSEPTPEKLFLQKLFLWLLRSMYGYDFKCSCGKSGWFWT